VRVNIALLDDAGFDLVHPFDAHAVAREVGVAALVDRERPAGYLVANTRALWPRFLAARRADRELATCEHPIDRYVEQTCERLGDARVLFAHRAYGGAFLPFQRIAVAAGFGTLWPSQLVIHPTYGPWFALRAVVLARGEPLTRVLPRAGCAHEDRCAASCTTAFESARDASGPQAWRAWLAVRDACCVGREHRYAEDQLAYHYTKDRELLA
jgi:cyanocobalamin reductase (cyanide-eliminating) / alkylcobalamin dealkylase